MVNVNEYDFSGYATRNDLLCGDGRIIRKNAFKHNDGAVVPLIYNHDHANPDAVLGHALLENRDDGVYAYGKFNDTEAGINAKKLVMHGDVRSLSIYANKLKQLGNDVIHGSICELSLVLAGANPGAYIDFVMAHGEGEEDALYANYDENALVIYHSIENKEDKKAEEEPEKKDEGEKKEDSDKKERTAKDVIDEMTDEQKYVVYHVVSKALGEEADTNVEDEKEDDKKEEEVKHSEGGNTTMKHNVFDQEENKDNNALSHSDMAAIFADAKRYGSLKDSALAHGIDQIDFLFPEAKALTNTPEFIQRDMGWVQKVMRSVHHTPFSRIKSVFADITADEARAKGYTKGNKKIEEVFGLLKRSTTPTTIYKKQKLDRDDVVDITDFDVVAWLKAEMRMMLDEEIARALLVGDGRSTASDDKINEQNIRPIWKDDELYTIKAEVKVASTATPDEVAKAFIRTAIKSRKEYKGSGHPVLYTTEDVLTDCLLMEDKIGHVVYGSVEKLATALRVKEIVTVPVMEGLTRMKDDGSNVSLMGIIVNLNDYNVGADKGGAVNMFDDFDIDYNQQKYLIETRCSGALTKPKSAIAIEMAVANGSGNGMTEE